jgi:hypothetical protein
VGFSYKILGRSRPSTSYLTLYEAPSGLESSYASRDISHSIVSLITVSADFNIFGFTRNYDIRVVPSADVGSEADKHLIFSGRLISDSSSDFIHLGIGLQPGDRIQVKINGGTAVTFSAFGAEVY